MAPKKKGSSSATAAASSASSTSAATKSSAATSKQAASTSPASKQTAAAAPNPQQLPAKDQSTFKLLVRLYEQKQYKKGIKQADAILKKHPTHGETLAMKGLLLFSMNQKSEAYAYVKKGLAFNLKSYVCWHVYGLLYRGDRKYSDSVKCYQQALKIAPDNQQVWKDLSNLQIQLRQIDGYIETRRIILTQKANDRSNWLAYAVANHLAGLRSKAIEILDAYERARGQTASDPNEDQITVSFENSELVLYRNHILEEQGDIQRAYDHLIANEKRIVDKLSYRTKKAQYHEQLQQYEQAEQEWRDLLAMNPDNYSYHAGLRRALKLYPASVDNDSDRLYNAPAITSNAPDQSHGVDSSHVPIQQPCNTTTHPYHHPYTAEQIAQLLALYDDLSKQFPRSTACKRLPLSFTTGHSHEFRTRLDHYIQSALRKNIPSLYNDLKPLYADASKVAVIDDLINKSLTNLRQYNAFSSEIPSSSSVESPSTLLWTLVYAASHYDRLQQYDRALQLTEEAIQHTPTLLDLYQLKARIYKHSHDYQAAFHYMNIARKMDTQDRFLNTKTVRYAWRADKQSDAESIIQLFLRDGDGLAALKDLQVMWYELASGESHVRQGKLGRALKQFWLVDKHFTDIIEDQFDFHTYTLRKMTLRAYIDMINWEDEVRGHRFFYRAAINAVRIYLQLHDKLQQQRPTVGDDTTMNGGKPQANGVQAHNDSDQKPAAAASTTKKADSSKDKKAEDDDDPNGDQLLKTTEPLAEAMKFFEHLRLHSPHMIDTHVLAIDLHIRRKKPLPLLQAIQSGRQIDANHPDLHLATIRGLHHLSSAKHDSQHVQRVIDQQIRDITNGEPLTELNDDFYQRNSGSLRHRLAYSKAVMLLDPSNTQRAVHAVSNIRPSIDNNMNGTASHQIHMPSTSVTDVEAVYDFLRQHDATAADNLTAEAHQIFPYTPRFGAQPVALEGKAAADTQSRQHEEARDEVV